MAKINYQVLDENKIDSLNTEVDISYGVQGDKEVASVDVEAQEIDLDITGLPIEVDVDNIQALPNETYAILRRNGFGGSDSSILLGVNPYKTLPDLIKEKASKELSEEEKEIGMKVAVRKGNDLEPLVIKKYMEFMGARVIKPTDMYVFKDYPYLKMNFDGVNIENEKPFPVEIKVATSYGQKNYNPAKAIFNEFVGFAPLPQNISNTNNSIETKAAHYGIPKYYYTQLQQEMMACDADYGHIAVIFDKDWTVHIWHVWKDEAVQNQIKLQAYKAWQEVVKLRLQKGWTEWSNDDILKMSHEGNAVETPRNSYQEKLAEELQHEPY